MAEYRFSYSDDFLIESYRRYMIQSARKIWLLPLKVVCFIGLTLLLGVAIYNGLTSFGILLGFLLLLLAVGPRFDYWLSTRRFRKSPFRNKDVHLTISESGLTTADELSHMQLAWPVFTKARRFPDGFLLFFGPQQFYWWPDSALTNGSVSEVEALVRGNVADYKIS